MIKQTPEEILKYLWNLAKEGCVDSVENTLNYVTEEGMVLPENEVRIIKLTAFELGYEESLENINSAIKSAGLNTGSIINILQDAKKYKIAASEIRKGRKSTENEIHELFPDYEVKRIKKLIEQSITRMNEINKTGLSGEEIKKYTNIYYNHLNIGSL